MQFSRELYKNPSEAPTIGQKYWDLLGIPNRINVSQGPEEPWFPGALMRLPDPGEDHEIPGLKQIIFNEDYQYNMIAPEMLDDFLV